MRREHHWVVWLVGLAILAAFGAAWLLPKVTG